MQPASVTKMRMCSPSLNTIRMKKRYSNVIAGHRYWLGRYCRYDSLIYSKTLLRTYLFYYQSWYGHLWEWQSAHLRHQIKQTISLNLYHKKSRYVITSIVLFGLITFSNKYFNEEIIISNRGRFRLRYAARGRGTDSIESEVSRNRLRRFAHHRQYDMCRLFGGRKRLMSSKLIQGQLIRKLTITKKPSQSQYTIH